MPTQERRKTHVFRVYGDNSGGFDNTEVWIDIEILDGYVWKRGKGVQAQETVWKLKDAAETNRDYAYVRVENPEDKDQFVLVKVWNAFAVKRERGEKAVKTVHHRKNIRDELPRRFRNIDVRKIVHREIDDEALDEEKQPPRDPDDYLDAIEDADLTDEDQYINFEVVHKYQLKRGRGFEFQGTGIKPALGNTKLLPKEEESDKDDEPVMLDPLQNIVNVGFDAGLAVEFGDKAEGPPKGSEKK